MELSKKSLEIHKEYKGKIETKLKFVINNKNDLSLAYTPGVGEVVKAIIADKKTVNDYTNRANLVAVVTDGSAVLGFGNVGPEAAYPVMEGKAVLFKNFAQIDAWPICLKTQDVDEIVTIVSNLEPTFAGINLEDISAPRCFEIEDKLKKIMNIPVFHDDQHGTAIVVLAALINAMKVVKKDISKIKIVVNGAGAAGVAITKMLINYGIHNIIVLDSIGAICQGREKLNWIKTEIAEQTNKKSLHGGLENVLQNADVFIGVSAPNILRPEWIKIMNEKPVIFAMANPIPEIDPDLAKKSGAAIVATGRTDYPNQVNNVLAFPGVFRGALDAQAKQITEKMKLQAALALAEIIPESKLSSEYIIPDPFNPQIVIAISQAINKAK